MKLIGQLDSPFVRRAAVALIHYGFRFEFAMLSVFSDFEAILRMNPLGRVPFLLLDDGNCLFDSESIVDFGESQAPVDRRLMPATSADYRKVLQVESVAVGLMEKAVALRLETVHRGSAIRDVPWIERLERQITSGLEWLEQIPASPWLHGASFTRADVSTAIAFTNLRKKFSELVPLGKYPGLEAHCERAESLQVFAAAPFPGSA
jgi:glutathione S-transferase